MSRWPSISRPRAPRDQRCRKSDNQLTIVARLSAAGRAQGGRAADFGNGEGGLLQAAREYISPNVVMDTSGGDPSTGGLAAAAPRAGDAVSFTPLLPPRMPPKDEQ